MAKNRMWLDTSGMESWIEELDKMGADVKGIGGQALTETARKIQSDVSGAIIMAGATVVGYVIGEGLADAANNVPEGELLEAVEVLKPDKQD